MTSKKDLEQYNQELAAGLQQELDQNAVLTALVARYELALEQIRVWPALGPDITDYHLWVDVQRQMRAVAYEALVPTPPEVGKP